MKKEILSFDLTGTMATFRFCDSIYFEGLPKLYANRYGVDIQVALQNLTRAYDEVGDQEADWYDLTYWFDRFDLGNGWHSLLNDLRHNIQLYPETEKVLSKLNEKYELILISNACREFLEIETSSINKYFSKLISCVSDFGEVNTPRNRRFRGDPDWPRNAAPAAARRRLATPLGTQSARGGRFPSAS